MCDMWCSQAQMFMGMSDVWWLWKCSQKLEVFKDFLTCVKLIWVWWVLQSCLFRLINHLSGWHCVEEQNMPLGAAQIFFINNKGNSQRCYYWTHGFLKANLGLTFHLLNVIFVQKKNLGAEKISFKILILPGIHWLVLPVAVPWVFSSKLFVMHNLSTWSKWYSIGIT